ncbi:hypothetical protein R1flu_017504 [Riccia fluitans]|uniref:Uncharacterized protein n=1 Tax=Riccia fluitans TaxID=41844 RepID=A0ABD1ZEG4_9MARC
MDPLILSFSVEIAPDQHHYTQRQGRKKRELEGETKSVGGPCNWKDRDFYHRILISSIQQTDSEINLHSWRWPLGLLRRCYVRGWNVIMATGNGQDFGSQASRVVKDASRKAQKAAREFSSQAEKLFEQAKRNASKLGKEDEDLQTKLNRFAQAAIRKLEEVTYDVKRWAAKWDREYQITEKAQQAFEYASEQVQSVDRQLGVGRKTRELTVNLRLKWPTYRRQLSDFLETPIGKSAGTVFLLWLLVSGWFFRLLLFSMWVIPFLPLLISKFGKAAIVQGTCPNCGMQYVGGRNQIVTCSRCRGVVWQPRTDFSRDSKADPQIIDIDIDSK